MYAGSAEQNLTAIRKEKNLERQDGVRKPGTILPPLLGCGGSLPRLLGSFWQGIAWPEKKQLSRHGLPVEETLAPETVDYITLSMTINKLDKDTLNMYTALRATAMQAPA